MNAQDFAIEIRSTLVKLKAEGVSTLEVDNVIAYLDEALQSFEAMPSNPSAVDVELYKANLQKWVEEYKNIHAHGVEMFRSVIASGQGALRTAFLMNGGGAIAMLSFVGSLATSNPQRVAELAFTLAVFVVGVLLVAAASGWTYLSQLFYAGRKKWTLRVGAVFHVLAILFPITSYVTFAWGMYEGYKIFASYA